LGEELVERMKTGRGARIERIVSRGHASSEGFWYDQEEHEWVVVLSGRARLRFQDGGDVELGPGDYVDIAAHTRHRVEWTAPEVDTVWLAVFYREGQMG
jgi:cupin 2 domain-containing protein